jgi:PTS system nitrogen regulatory IIA component
MGAPSYKAKQSKAKQSKAKALSHPVTLLATLNSEIDFGGTNDRPVHTICVLLSPERDGPLHLRRLSRLSRLFKCDALVTKIKDAKDETTIRSLLIDPQGWMLAA